VSIEKAFFKRERERERERYDSFIIIIIMQALRVLSIASCGGAAGFLFSILMTQFLFFFSIIKQLHTTHTHTAHTTYTTTPCVQDVCQKAFFKRERERERERYDSFIIIIMQAVRVLSIASFCRFFVLHSDDAISFLFLYYS
jgi:flagellar basal body-associated protein FliL